MSAKKTNKLKQWFSARRLPSPEDHLPPRTVSYKLLIASRKKKKYRISVTTSVHMSLYCAHTYSGYQSNEYLPADIIF